ncbi:MAG: hypothetical protein ABL921_18565 [Pirellula sp.]
MNETPVDLSANPKATIDWYRSAPWWRLASQCIGISWRATHLLLCAAALFLTQLWISAANYLFQGHSAVASWIIPSETINPLALRSSDWMRGPIISVWQQYLSYVFHWLQTPTLNVAAESLASMIGIVAIWSWVGGCLCRRSVVELGTRMTAPWSETFRLVLKRWQSIAWSVSMPALLVLLMAVGPLVLGWISNIPAVGIWIAGLLLIPVLFCTIGIGWCAAISVFGFPLSVCSVVTEKQADAYDGISRSAAYTFQRPLTLALCVVGMQLLGTVGSMVVTLVLSTGFGVIEAGFIVGSFTSISEMESMWAPILNGIVPLLVTSFSFSFFWSAAAATYLILRRDVDHADFDLIDMDVPTEPKALPDLPKMEERIPAELTDNSAE